MHINIVQCFIISLFYFVNCRDFYIGMFKRRDFLVAQDRLYKEKVPFRMTYAKYGRVFKCPITYLRVADRLGVGRGPKVEIIRGGLRKNYVVLRVTSSYNYPISVNIYVGCENKITTAVVTPTVTVTDTTLSVNDNTTGSNNNATQSGNETEVTETTAKGAMKETTAPP